MTTLVLTFGSLTLFSVWGFLRPRQKLRFPALRRRTGNLGFWIFNTTSAALIFVATDDLRTPWQMPLWLSIVIGFLLLDVMAYAIHRLLHAVPVLWRFHALHHSDPDVDWTTAVRHHPAEYLGSGVVHWIVILATGIPGPVLGLHALMGFALAIATHANVRWPAWLERALQPIVITLDLHLAHHSIDVAQSNTNFGEVLAIWDRLFGTYRRLTNEPVFGVRELDPRDACKPTEMLLTPLRIGKMYQNTHRRPDGREVEVSAQHRGNVLRLRANLVNAGVIEAAHRGDYVFDVFDPAMVVRDIAEFTAEFAAITGVELAPLFPDNLFGAAPQAQLVAAHLRPRSS
jgi:sterol desaturase/sphingolipid hydroxylase (fatty acid hydroxylase superfamily)